MRVLPLISSSDRAAGDRAASAGKSRTTARLRSEWPIKPAAFKRDMMRDSVSGFSPR